MRAPIPPPTETGAHTHMAVGVPRTGGRAPAHRRHHADGNAGRRSAPRDAMNGLVEPNLKGSRIPFLFGGGNGPLVEQREPLDAEGFRTADRSCRTPMVTSRRFTSDAGLRRDGTGPPIVDNFVLDYSPRDHSASTTSWKARRQCRLLERRASELAETLPTWARHIAPRRRVAKAGDAPHRRKAPHSRAHRRQDPTS